MLHLDGIAIADREHRGAVAPSALAGRGPRHQNINDLPASNVSDALHLPAALMPAHRDWNVPGRNGVAWQRDGLRDQCQGFAVKKAPVGRALAPAVETACELPVGCRPIE